MRKPKLSRLSYRLAVHFPSVYIGWSLAQLGPSFLDLQIITGTTLDQASTYFTFHYVGYLTGSLVTGLIYDKIVYDKSVVLVLTIVGHTAVLAVIPWCTIYEVMVFVFTLKGVFSGGFETCGTAHMILVCGSDNAALLQALYFAFGAGGIISPYAIAPFLAEETNGQHNRRNTSIDIGHLNSKQNISTTAFLRNDTNMDLINGNATYLNFQESSLYIGYTITAVLTLSTAIPFVILFMKSKCRKESTDKTEESTKTYPKRSKVMLIIIIIILSVISGLYWGLEDAFNNFLATFCVKHLGWTKVSGATATSVYWSTLSIGRFFAIFFIRHFKPNKLIMILFSSLLVSQTGFLVLAQFKLDIGVWVSIGCIGLSGSVLLPLVFTWTEEDITQMTGKITSILMISASVGASINPIIIGFTMDNYSPMWLSYILTTETIVCILLSLIILVNTYQTRKQDKLNANSHVNPGFQTNSLSEEESGHRDQQSDYVYSIHL